MLGNAGNCVFSYSVDSAYYYHVHCILFYYLLLAASLSATATHHRTSLFCLDQASS